MRDANLSPKETSTDARKEKQSRTSAMSIQLSVRPVRVREGLENQQRVVVVGRILYYRVMMYRVVRPCCIIMPQFSCGNL